MLAPFKSSGDKPKVEKKPKSPKAKKEDKKEEAPVRIYGSLSVLSLFSSDRLRPLPPRRLQSLRRLLQRLPPRKVKLLRLPPRSLLRRRESDPINDMT